MIRSQKLFLDLRWDLLQPYLGTICPISIKSDIRPESIYLVLGRDRDQRARIISDWFKAETQFLA
jgi:hypothetical protein